MTGPGCRADSGCRHTAPTAMIYGVREALRAGIAALGLKLFGAEESLGAGGIGHY